MVEVCWYASTVIWSFVCFFICLYCRVTEIMGLMSSTITWNMARYPARNLQTSLEKGNIIYMENLIEYRFHYRLCKCSAYTADEGNGNAVFHWELCELCYFVNFTQTLPVPSTPGGHPSPQSQKLANYVYDTEYMAHPSWHSWRNRKTL